MNTIVSVITVGMNHYKYIEALYASLYKMCPSGYQIEAIYVDNCSSDGSIEFLRNHYPQVKIIQNTEPLGFGENNNKGVMASVGDIIAIVNPDIVLLDGCLDIMVDYVLHKGNNAVVAPQLLNPDGTVQFSVRSFMTLSMFFKRLLSKGNDNNMSDKMIRYLCKDIDTEKIQPVDWAMGAALFMKRDIYARLGGFDQRYFLYMEDEDFCLRAWKTNIPVIYCPLSKMIHNHLRGSSKLGKKTLYHFRSMRTFFERHGFFVEGHKDKYTMS